MNRVVFKKYTGFVLPLTLIILAILTSLAMGLSQQGRNRLKEVQRQQTLWQDELVYRSVLQQIFLIFLVGEVSYNKATLGSQQLFLDGTPNQFADVEVRIQDTGGLLPIGRYRPEWLRPLVQQLTDETTASRITAEYGDWIDTDNSKQINGMEAMDYLAAGKKYVPRNAPVRHLDELLELPSMNATLYNGAGTHPGLRDLLHPGDVGLNVATAPPLVLQAMLGLSASEAQLIVETRQQQNWAKVAQLIPHPHPAYSDGNPFAASGVYRIKLRRPNGARLTTEVDFAPVMSPKLFEILTWYYPDSQRGWL